MAPDDPVCLLGEMSDAGLDALAPRAKAQDADASHETAFVLESREHNLAALDHALEQLARRRVLLGARGTGPLEVEREQRELRLCIDDDMRDRGHALAGFEGQRAFLEQRRAITRGAVELEREPEPQTGEITRE